MEHALSKVYEAINDDKKITAIKEFKALSGLGLKACKEIVEIMIDDREKRKSLLLDEAIDHWNHLFDMVRTLPMTARHCSLCKEYIDCVDCPVATVSGSEGCRNTPYMKVKKAQDQLTSAMAKEIDFLRGLKNENSND